jgi:hypothetical protein
MTTARADQRHDADFAIALATELGLRCSTARPQE